MGKGRTHITQHYEIKLDLSDFVELLRDRLLEAVALSEKDIQDVSLDDWEYDEEYIIFKGSYRTGADTWYYKQTLEEPEDSGYEPDANLSAKAIAEELRNILGNWTEKDIAVCGGSSVEVSINPLYNLVSVNEVDDDFDPEFDDDGYDDGPDPDRAYDEWRDRQYEDD